MNLTRLVPKSPWLAVTKSMEVSEKYNTVKSAENLTDIFC